MKHDYKAALGELPTDFENHVGHESEDYLYAYRDTIRHAPAWQPIETAPYGKVIILGFFDGEIVGYEKDADCYVCIGKLYERYNKAPSASALSNVGGNFVNVNITDSPTHWMPLPEPPKEETK